MAGGVDDNVGQVAVEKLAKLAFESIPRLDCVLDAHMLVAEVEPALVEIDNDYFCAGELDKFERRQANRPRAHDQARFSPGQAAAVDGVAANGERLDERQLLERQLCRGMELAG